MAEVSYEVNDESGGAAQMTMISEDGDFDGTTFEIHDYTVEGAEDGVRRTPTMGGKRRNLPTRPCHSGPRGHRAHRPHLLG
ncbi:MAG: hypothetical protein ACLTDR_08890 [Adlercreutzia equolifaciens]